jgi:hypothetical protein
VVLDVLVTSGRLPVAGLTADDLEVLDNGVPQKVEAIQLDRMPIDISLVVDFFNEVEVGGFSLARKVWSPRLAERTREDMINVAAELRPTDRLRLLQVDDNLGRELWPMQSPPFPIERLPIVSNHLSETARPRATYGRMQGLYDITAAALLRQAEADRRHLVVAFTDGVDGASATPPSLLLAVARESQSAMYVARRDTQTEFAAMEGIRNVTPYRPLLWPPDPHIIERAAESTGGSVFFHPQGSLLPDFRKIFNLFRSSYVVRYQPTSQTPGWHDVTVRVVKAGKFDVKVRRGYSIPK